MSKTAKGMNNYIIFFAVIDPAHMNINGHGHEF
jgi:hypothetical protein